MAPSDLVAGDATPENTLDEVDTAAMLRVPGPRPGGLPDAPPGRGNVVSHVHDGKSLTLLDHSRNANPQSMEAALKTLAGWPVAEGGARIAVLSDMLELGTQAPARHAALAREIIDTGIHQVWLAGELMQSLWQALPPQYRGGNPATAEALFAELPNRLRHGDVLMFKGSNATGLQAALKRWLKISAARSPRETANSRLIAEIIARGENDFSDSPFLHHKGALAPAMIKAAATQLGCTVVPVRGPIFAVERHGIRAVFVRRSPGHAFVVGMINQNKQIAKRVLARAGLPVPKGAVFDDEQAALRYFKAASRKRALVVKPLQGSEGRGVTTRVRNAEAFALAWASARQVCARVIVENHLPGDDIRVLVLGGRSVAAYVRVPANVIGNGRDTIATLIKLKNAQRRRNPRLRHALIRRWELLADQGRCLDDVAAQGEQVFLTSVANISMGGDLVELTNQVHPAILALAERAVQALPGLQLAGVDLIVENLRLPPHEGGVSIIEVNSMPEIAGISFANHGNPVDIPRMLVEHALSVAQSRGQERPRPHIAPAPAYRQTCDGNAFPRNAATQWLLLRQAAHRRGLRVEAPARRVTRISNGQHDALFYLGMPHSTPSLARHASNDKEWTRALLAEGGIRVPAGQAFGVDAQEDAWRFALALNGPVVVKPLQGSGGKGVSVGIRDIEHFQAAWEHAVATKARTILVEEQLRGRDFRVMVVGSRIVSATERVPAYVMGDGRRSIEQLVARKNAEREGNPYYGAKPMALTAMMLHKLAGEGLNAESVPEEGRRLALHAVANIGAGGESRDVSDDIHPGWAPIMVAARHAVFDPLHVGVDLMAEDIARAPDAQHWAIIEVNTNPDLGLVHFPGEGPPRDVAGVLIDALLPLADTEPPGPETYRVTLYGKVQGVGYRRWLWTQAHLHAVRGWVANRRDQTVAAVFHGTPAAVQALLKLCEKGPKTAEVTRIDAEKMSVETGEPYADFRIRKTV